MAEGEGRYNPIGYHVGTVWPFDNSFIAWGLRRYGFREEAARIAAGILDAAEFFDGRLPEAFGGYARELTQYPVQYPTACSPQAWSTGAPLLLLRTMLGLEPLDEPPGRRPGAAPGHRPPGAARHPRPVGPDRRLRTRVWSTSASDPSSAPNSAMLDTPHQRASAAPMPRPHNAAVKPRLR